MLKKPFRLSLSKDIKVTSLRGRSFFNPLFVVKYVFGPIPRPRIAIIASTKVSKKAVIRNRLKRLVREELRLVVNRLRAGDYIIIIKSTATKKTPAEIRESLNKLLKAVKLLL